ncbi:hypothetical protein QFC19_000025 [Naganishia cerealis]|uniref:Uncharacterized protein n=1 Tax=Naganishia cerealis TaxID=610337 RepID=A0ACC2WS30_9TREE|nr:hypothetical protein QFC19_000025 [Naganishia cerealis]
MTVTACSPSSSNLRSPPLAHRPLTDPPVPGESTTAMIPSRSLTSVNHLPQPSQSLNGHLVQSPGSPHRRATASIAIRSSSPSRAYSFGPPGGGNRGSVSTVSMRTKHHWDDKNLQEMIDDQQMSKVMQSIPLQDEDIKRLPRKLRKYYENMASLKESYEEVDALLASNLPSTIVTSFTAGASSYGGTVGEIDEDPTAAHGWTKQSDHYYGALLAPHEAGHGGGNQSDNRQVGEDEPLLPTSQQKEEKREKVAKLALNGELT